MTALTADHRKYILVETLIGTVFNTVISIVFAFVAAGGAASLPLWGPRGIALDFVPTVFMITLVTTLIVTLLTRKRLRAGKAPPLPRADAGPLGWGPRQVFLRALTYGLLFAIVLVPLSIGALVVLGIDEMATSAFVLFKAVYGAVYSLLVTPPIVRAALAGGD